MSRVSTHVIKKSEIILFLLTLVTNVDSARILAFLPSASYSHHITFKPLITELVQQNHEVTVLTPFPIYKDEKSDSNLIQIDLSSTIKDISKKYFQEQKFGYRSDIFYHIQYGLNVVYLAVPELILKSKPVQDFLKNDTKFDVLIIESFCRMALGLSSIYKVPVVLISSSYSVGAYSVVGGPEHPVFYPACYRNKIFNLTIAGAIKSIIVDSFATYKRNKLQELEDNAMKRMFPKVSSIEELSRDVSLLMINVDPIWEGNRPVPPSVVHLGGMHLEDTKKLPEDINIFLNESVNGVIFISFGTNFKVQYISPKVFNTLLNVFSQLPYNIIWKCDFELPAHVKNIKTSKWLPQADLLRHPKIKLFITQAGLQSTDEAIFAGVPLLGIPTASDQWAHAELYEHHKIGLKLEISEITEDTLNNSIHILVNDESYRANINKLRSIMNDQRQRPLHRAVSWIEYVIKHRTAAHLRSPGANIKWTQYYEVELLLIVLCLVSLSLCAVIMFVQLIDRSVKCTYIDISRT